MKAPTPLPVTKSIGWFFYVVLLTLIFVGVVFGTTADLIRDAQRNQLTKAELVSDILGISGFLTLLIIAWYTQFQKFALKLTDAGVSRLTSHGRVFLAWNSVTEASYSTKSVVLRSDSDEIELEKDNFDNYNDLLRAIQYALPPTVDFLEGTLPDRSEIRINEANPHELRKAVLMICAGILIIPVPFAMYEALDRGSTRFLIGLWMLTVIGGVESVGLGLIRLCRALRSNSANRKPPLPP